MKILVLEDNVRLCQLMKESLEKENYKVDVFMDGDDALDAIYEKKYNLLLLDIRVPGIDGFELVNTIRKSGIDTPVMMLTSLTDISSLSKGYELGCNDYLKKPFDLLELKYRIDQLIKDKCFNANNNIIKIYENYTFDIQKNILYKQQIPVDLSQKEIQVISLLIQNRGIYVSIESLHDFIWENKDIQYADIRMCIKRIRDKTDKSFIITKRFIGYKIDK